MLRKSAKRVKHGCTKWRKKSGKGFPFPIPIKIEMTLRMRQRDGMSSLTNYMRWLIPLKIEELGMKTKYHIYISI